MFQGIIDVPASILIDLLFDGIEEFPLWNKLVTESIKLEVIFIFSFYCNVLLILQQLSFLRISMKTRTSFIKQQVLMVVDSSQREISLS